MSDFGAGACDFHSDFSSDFRAEGNDYAGDFGGGPRTEKWPPDTPGHRDRTTGAGRPPTRQQVNENGGKLAAQAVSHGAWDNATP